MSYIKTLKLYNSLPQEFNLAALKARGCLQEMYKINEKINSVDSQIDLINKMKNSDKITEEIYGSMDNNNNNQIIKLKKPKINKLNKFDVDLVKFVRDKDTNLFINEERVRMNKAIESLQKINNCFKKKNTVLYPSDAKCLKANKSDINLIKINPKKRLTLFSPLKLDKKIKFKFNDKIHSVNKFKNSNDNNKNENISSMNEDNNKFEFKNKDKKFFSNNTSLPKILLSPCKDRSQDTLPLINNKIKSKFTNINKPELVNENKKTESVDDEVGFNSGSEDSKSIFSKDEEEEEDRKIIPQKINGRRKSVFMDDNKFEKLNHSDILNDIKKSRRHSCIDINQLKINLGNLCGAEESNGDKHKMIKIHRKEGRQKSDMTNFQNHAISPIFPDKYRINKYFASPIERLKNIYSINFEKKKLILPKI